MAEPAAHEIEDPILACVRRGERYMAALAGERDPAPLDRQDSADSQAGARADDPDGSLRGRRADAADTLALPSIQMRGRRGDCGEVVDHEQMLDSKARLQRFLREGPRMIGEDYEITRHRAGDIDRGRRGEDSRLSDEPC